MLVAEESDLTFSSVVFKMTHVNFCIYSSRNDIMNSGEVVGLSGYVSVSDKGTNIKMNVTHRPLLFLLMATLAWLSKSLYPFLSQTFFRWGSDHIQPAGMEQDLGILPKISKCPMRLGKTGSWILSSL